NALRESGEAYSSHFTVEMSLLGSKMRLWNAIAQVVGKLAWFDPPTALVHCQLTQLGTRELTALTNHSGQG
ncbi:MAG TPA: hypothetical protein VF182_17055, partial [Candidatus Binatia bacterium]